MASIVAIILGLSLFLGLAGVCISVNSGSLAAKSGQDFGYNFDQTFATSVRLIRVDLGYKITERDDKAGFLRFDYKTDGKVVPGSIEVIATDDGTRVFCTISDMPSYHETLLLQKLDRKLREELGPPKKIEHDAGSPLPDSGNEGGE
jgi:hypothetical protein